MADIRRAMRRLRVRIVYGDEVSDREVPLGAYNDVEAIEDDYTGVEGCIVVENTRG